MVTSSSQFILDRRLAQQARERYAKALDPLITGLARTIHQELRGLTQGNSSNISSAQLAMDAFVRFQAEYRRWATAVYQDWRAALQRSGTADASISQSAALGLLDDEVVEKEILVSRFSLAVQDKAHWELNHLRMRIQRLEGGRELAGADLFRPEVFARLLIQAWLDCGMTRPMWALVQDSVHAQVAQHLNETYRDVNEFLVKNGVMAEIDLKSMVRRTEDSGSPASPAQMREAQETRQHGAASPMASAATAAAPSSPLARARQRAWDVLGQVRRLLADHTAAGSASGYAAAPSLASTPPSPPLARALLERRDPFAPTELAASGQAVTMVMPVSVEVAALRLRERADELKAKAEAPTEKAIIEIVALMFQSILAEERIPASVRVWFARLQFPVLRLALAEPDFFASVEHPARRLIDRMGACALGFHAGEIAGSQLEREIKRIVQVIEQYPETGRRVYQLLFEEFKRFLGRSLTKGSTAQQVATLAQQVEQKEALSIQYTIELRKMLASLHVREEMREFLFRVWAEVLAMAAVRLGPQHEQTLRYKQAAADLLWAISAKPTRAERSRVVQQLPGLLHSLREGMNILAIPAATQDRHIKLVNDAVMQAFVSRAEGMSAETLDELVRGIAGLEDVVTNDAEGDVMLDPGLIEMMSGVDAAMLEVIAIGGTEPTRPVLAWAEELDLGAWFALDRSGSTMRVQYVWKSQRGQLHLFASSAGKSYLVQTRRLASYLQAGLLVPMEDEALTVRATREALAKLDAEPSRLLG
ncbi:DUF1631 family protein [Ottowia sp. VDI28]|uniref:DUF1631 family protein n=1 Tax=Ottowia sp. VDI28 TaxID=3133968 RepID=UPI003C2C534E